MTIKTIATCDICNTSANIKVGAEGSTTGSGIVCMSCWELYCKPGSEDLASAHAKQIESLQQQLAASEAQVAKLMEEKEALGHELAELVNTTEIRRFLQNKTIEELRAKLAEFSSCDGYCADDGDFHHFLSRNSNVRRKVYHREGE